MSVEAKVRAKWTRTALARVPEAVAEGAFARLDPSVRQSVEAASLVGWIPVEHHIALCGEWHASLGDQTFRRLFRDAFLDAVNAPLLGAIVQGSVRVFGSTPIGAAKAWTVGWPYIFRHGGQAAVRVEAERHVVASITQLPPSMRAEPFVLGCAGSFEGNAVLVGERGEARYDMSQLSAGAFELSLTW